MKRIKSIYVFSVLICAIGAVSCKKESMLPEPAAGAEKREAAMDLNPGPVAAYPVLTKHGAKTLTYTADKKLKSVNFGNGTMINYTYPAQFPNLILAKESFNGNVYNDITYFLDGSGRCSKMSIKYILNGAGVIDYDYEFVYQNNRLVEQKGVKGTSELYTFGYDAQNRLKVLNEFSAPGVLSRHTKYEYDNFNGVAQDDKYPLNPAEAHIDGYLPIFGKFSKHLVLSLKTFKGAGSTSNDLERMAKFIYTRNAAGFVTKRAEEYWNKGQGYQPWIFTNYEYDGVNRAN
jgi:hypothetical protein